MNTQARRQPRLFPLVLATLLLANVALLPGDVAEAAPDPTGIQVQLAPDPAGNCVATVTWSGGKGQLYIEFVLLRDEGPGNSVQGWHSQKVSAAGDPRGSYSLTHVFTGLESGEYLIDVTVKRAKGKGGANGAVIDWASWINTGNRASCGEPADIPT